MSFTGVSIYVVSAICGCFWRESGVNPAIWENLRPCAWDYQYEYTHKGGYGLGQWTNVGTQHGRLYHLHEWVTNNGYADGDGNGQLEYMAVEGYWTNSSSSRLGYTSLSQFMHSDSTSLEDLVWDFLANWEGVVGDHYSERLGYARQVYNYILLHAGDNQSYSWVSGNRYLSNSDRLNNSMVIYRYFQGVIPPTGQYTILVQVSGNGTCTVYPTTSDGNENITVTLNAGAGDTCTDIELRDTDTWQSIASTLDPNLQTQTFFMPLENVTVVATFTGIPPTPPPQPTFNPVLCCILGKRKRRRIIHY